MTRIIAFCGLNCSQCGVKNQVSNCAECPEYGCEKINRFMGFVPDASKTLEQIRQARLS